MKSLDPRSWAYWNLMLEATTSLKNDTAVLLQSMAGTASEGAASNVELELMILGAAIIPSSL